MITYMNNESDTPIMTCPICGDTWKKPAKHENRETVHQTCYNCGVCLVIRYRESIVAVRIEKVYEVRYLTSNTDSEYTAHVGAESIAEAATDVVCSHNLGDDSGILSVVKVDRDNIEIKCDSGEGTYSVKCDKGLTLNEAVKYFAEHYKNSTMIKILM